MLFPPKKGKYYLRYLSTVLKDTSVSNSCFIKSIHLCIFVLFDIFWSLDIWFAYSFTLFISAGVNNPCRPGRLLPLGKQSDKDLKSILMLLKQQSLMVIVLFSYFISGFVPCMSVMVVEFASVPLTFNSFLAMAIARNALARFICRKYSSGAMLGFCRKGMICERSGNIVCGRIWFKATSPFSSVGTHLNAIHSTACKIVQLVYVSGRIMGVPFVSLISH